MSHAEDMHHESGVLTVSAKRKGKKKYDIFLEVKMFIKVTQK